MDYKKELSLALAQAANLPAQEILPMIEIPTDTNLGDYAFPCFALAKTYRKAPPAIAAEFAKK